MTENAKFGAELDVASDHILAPASRDEVLRTYIARVQAESALTPGPAGRLANIVNGLQLSDNPAIQATSTIDNGMEGSTLFHGRITYPYSSGYVMNLIRSTSYRYDGTRMPPGNDSLNASVTRLSIDESATTREAGELAIIEPGIEEVGLWIRQIHSDGSWAMDGFFRRTVQPGEVIGAQHAWTTISPEEADMILDKIFPASPAELAD